MTMLPVKGDAQRESPPKMMNDVPEPTLRDVMDHLIRIDRRLDENSVGAASPYRHRPERTHNRRARVVCKS